jgi:hypothetical protein
MQQDDVAAQFARPLSAQDAADLVEGDLPHMSDAQIAALLTEIFMTEPSPLGKLLAPRARAELTRRMQATMGTARPA